MLFSKFSNLGFKQKPKHKMGNSTSRMVQNCTFILAATVFFHAALFTQIKKQFLEGGQQYFTSQTAARYSECKSVSCSRPFAKPVPKVQSPLLSPQVQKLETPLSFPARQMATASNRLRIVSAVLCPACHRLPLPGPFLCGQKTGFKAACLLPDPASPRLSVLRQWLFTTGNESPMYVSHLIVFISYWGKPRTNIYSISRIEKSEHDPQGCAPQSLQALLPVRSGDIGYRRKRSAQGARTGRQPAPPSFRTGPPGRSRVRTGRARPRHTRQLHARA